VQPEAISCYTLEMKIHRLDHVGINVEDLAAAKEFFLNLGLEVQGEMRLESELLDVVTRLKNAKTEMVMMRAPDGGATLELVTFVRPVDETGIQHPYPLANTLGMRHICFAVEDIEAIVTKLKKKGVEFFSEIQYYENIYKLCYLRGPEGMIVELAEEIQ
jgi:catechol 2,3-dioxygenase-like lactoylglutathione lyase family enzyme